MTAEASSILTFEAGEEQQLETQWDEPLEFVFIYPHSQDVQVLRDKWIEISNSKKDIEKQV